MADIVDARGLSCPQPVLMTMSKMKELSAGQIEVMVDNEVSKENVTRAATRQGWEIAEVREEADEYRLILKKQ
jgi:tRNA 2-thiouridine synthesizing protein A